LFGNQQAQPPTGGLFGNSGSGTSPTKERSQESPSRGGGGLFGNQQARSAVAGLFGSGGSKETSPKKEESKESPPRGGGGLFGNKQAPPPAGGLFGNSGGRESPPHGGGLFGNQQAQATTGGLFGNSGARESPPHSGGGLFGHQQAQPPTGGLFGKSGARESPPHGGGGGLFGNKPAQPSPGGLFSNGGGGTAGGGLVGSGGGDTEGGLFGSQAPQNQLPYYQPPEKLTDVYYGKGTLGYKFNLVKNRDKYLLSSITCASNADKSKTLEELRAEDYELMRSDELPEDIKLKLTQRREKLGLPASSPKGDPGVFKSSVISDGSMKSLFLSNKYSDVTFKVGNESIPAHRNLLGSCSQHFDNLFSKHELNTIPLAIEIPNVQPEAFKAILEYLYCGEVSLHEELAAELLILAPRFDLHDLAAGAEDFLTHVISVDNYLRMLETSDRIGSKSLRKQVWTFVIKNTKVISKREDFEELPRHLLMELMENVINA